MTCDRCFQSLDLGAHGEGVCPYEKRRSQAIQPDLVPGGFWVENGFDTPRRFDSKSEHLAALAAEGLEIRAKWAGPEDKIMSRWHVPDMEAAATLLGRGAEAVRERKNRWKDANTPITVAEGEAFTAKDLHAD